MPAGNADRAKNVALLGISLLFSLTVLELGLRASTPFPIHGSNANRVPHPVLGYTLDPSARDIDAAGFRNPRADGPCDIVAIGDSHTQGFNVKSAQSWPYLLAERLQVAVYNFGVGGYGMYHYPYLAERAAEKSPSIVYPANDLTQSRGLPRDTIAKIPDLDTKYLIGVETKRPARDDESLGEWLERSFAIASITSYFSESLTTSPDDYYDVGGHLLRKENLGWHQSSTDLSKPAIRADFRNSLNMLCRMKRDFDELGIRFGVVIIPSKELIVQEWALADGIPIPDGARADKERRLIDAYAERFADLGIDFTDATPFVLAAFQRDATTGKVFYPLGNGHPLENGYRSYADAAFALVQRLRSRPSP